MFNKLKKAVKYIVKKIKQGVEIVTEISKDIITGVSEVGKEVVSGTKDVVNTVGTTAVNRYADYMDKKLHIAPNIVKQVLKSMKNTNNRKVTGIVMIGIGLGVSICGGSLFTSGYIKEDEEV